MKLHALTLRDYRGITEAIIEPAPHGVTLVEGPNEIGKSSLSEALDLLFGDKDSTRKKSVLAIQPVGRDVGPFIEVDMEVGPVRFRYAKQYIKGKRTELTILTPRAEQLSGDEAHDRVTTLLSSHTDLALWRALRMEQAGNLLDPVDFEAQTALSDALDRAAGTAIKAGTTEQESIFEAAREEVLRYFTRTLKPGKDTTALEQRVNDLTGRLAALEQRELELEQDVARIERLEERLAHRRREQPALDRAVTGLEARDRATHQAAAALAKARSERDAARTRAADIERQHQQLITLADDLARAHTEATALGDAVAAADQTRTELQTQEQAARAALTAATHHADAARRADDALRDAQAAARNRQALKDVEARIARLDATDGQLRAARTTLAAIGVTRELLDDAVTAAADMKAAEQRLQEAAPAIRVEALADIELGHDGQVQSVPRGEVICLRTTADQSIEISRVARLKVIGGGDRETLETNRDTARARFDALLQSMGVESLADAQAALAQRDQLNALIGSLPAEVEQILHDDSRESLHAKRASLNDMLAAAAPPVGDTGETAVAELRKAYSDAVEALADARRAHETAAAQLQAHERETERLKTRLELKQTELQQLASRQNELGGNSAAGELDKALGDARNLVNQCDGAVATAREALGESDPESFAARLESARSAAQAARDAMAETDRELAAARGRLTVVSEAGLYEQIAHTAGELEQARATLRGHTRRATAARRLFETLRDARDAQRESYVAPMKQALEQLGRVVYGPDFAVEMNADLAIVSRTLNGSTVPFTDLSTGAREQLAVLIRLAAARVIDPTDGVPLILDDVLGHSDPDRLRSMNAVLKLAGDHCQIIVLTCYPERYLHAPRAKTIRLG